MDEPPPAVLAEFYLPKECWPRLPLQGDILDNVPRVLMPPSASVPNGGSPEAPVSGAASYGRTRAMIITPTCNMFWRGAETLIQVAAVIPFRGRDREAETERRKRGDHKRFLLDPCDDAGWQLANLTDVWSVRPEHLDGLPRVACLSDWGRSLLSDALYRAFARPVTDPTHPPDEMVLFRPS